MAQFGSRNGWFGHVCGLYYNVNISGMRLERTYLPQVQLDAHAIILATTAKVGLKQTFVNPSSERGIKEVRYTFPLYDGVSVVGFTCHIADRTIVGEVKEKEKARAVFKDAVARGETAGLFEQLPDASDVFTTTVGNIPPGAKVIINITYLGELKHDMQVDGIRFTIPNIICPRYGAYPGTLHNTSAVNAMGKNISITVDAQMAEGSFIQKIQSPTHPIAVQMGTTSVAPDIEPAMTRASATLTLDTAELGTDFVLQVIAKNTGVPKAVLENHPTIPNHRALMATLVPKLILPAEKPEIVFVCDRSGSMDGSPIKLVIQALKIFLKSIPIGVKFNICSFGSSHSFLWPKSVTYSQQTLDDAIGHAEKFDANYGGTEMLSPLKATIDQRYKDIPLDVIMLTDGEIWKQEALFSYLNGAVMESKEPIRIFTLGIGNGVSPALIEGTATAGNGFAQFVGEGEEMDTKVVRMLKGALSPHVHDYTLEVKYHTSNFTDDIDDFEIIEKATDSLKIKLDLKGEKQDTEEKKKPISLSDNFADPDKEELPADDKTGEHRYAHLPAIAVPKIIQAPQNIPPLFAFNRTTVYLLLGPEAPQETPVAVILRGTSKHGPLELEIPISILDTPGETIHQLAAKKAVAELEQGRGWLPEARDEQDALIKNKFQGRFNDMVEREAVRLGMQFQVGGRWTSFVAVESDKKSEEAQEKVAQDWEWVENESIRPQQQVLNQEQQRQQQQRLQQMRQQQATLFGSPSWARHEYNSVDQFASAQPTSANPPANHLLQKYEPQLLLLEEQYHKRMKMARQEDLNNTATSSSPPPLPPQPTYRTQAFSLDSASASPPPPHLPAQPQLFGTPATFVQPADDLSFDDLACDDLACDYLSFEDPRAEPAGLTPTFPTATSSALDDFAFDSSLHNDTTTRSAEDLNPNAPATTTQHKHPPPVQKFQTPEDLMHHLISLQSFEGSWEDDSTLLSALGIDQEVARRDVASLAGGRAVMTAIVIAVFEERLGGLKGSWELVVEKARGWLGGVVGEGNVEGMVDAARGVVGRG